MTIDTHDTANPHLPPQSSLSSQPRLSPTARSSSQSSFSMTRPSPPRPAGPRRPIHAGSSHTTLTTISTPRASDQHRDREDTTATVPSISDTVPVYRSPEVVVETIDDELSSPSRLPPGVLAEHIGDDDHLHTRRRHWSGSTLADGNDLLFKSDGDTPMDIDDRIGSKSTGNLKAEVPDRPQIGGGIMPRRLLQLLHEHEVWQPLIVDLPSPGRKALPFNSDQPVMPADPSLSNPLLGEQLTLEDVWDALPGGRTHHHEWYFCPVCWGWLHIVIGGPDRPPYLTVEEWAATNKVGNKSIFMDRLRSSVHLTDLLASPLHGTLLDGKVQHHFHEFRDIIEPTTETRLERVEVEGYKDAFAHLDPAIASINPSYTNFNPAQTDPILWVSCSSDVWIIVDKGPIAGQLAPDLVRDFTLIKEANPTVGVDGKTSVIDAWNLLITMLQNPLFKGQRGWIKMENPAFRNKIGGTLISAHVLEQIGFGCKQEDDSYRVGPLSKGETFTDEHVRHMNRYMVRSWVEINIYLQVYQKQHQASTTHDFVKVKPLTEELHRVLGILSIPELSPRFPDSFKAPLQTLGVTNLDVVNTIAQAYDFQISDDFDRMVEYLSALEALARAHVPGSESLQIKVATERSLERYTFHDLDWAYDLVGMSAAHVEAIMVSREEIPDSHVLMLHREEMLKARNAAERVEISRALVMIGKDRKSDLMVKIGQSGLTYISLDQAYLEFNLTRNSPIDSDILIMQFETWIADRPSRAEHYRMALSVIANAPGEERPVLQAYLEGKDVSELQAPVRRDIPVGLKNIGNTCYLNSVLQFLYAIRPIRERIMIFDSAGTSTEAESDTGKASETRIKVQSSRRFASLLRELFTQMFQSDSSAVVPQEELARLAILPIDVVGERERDTASFVEEDQNLVTGTPLLEENGTSVSSHAANFDDTPRSELASLIATTPPSRASSLPPSIPSSLCPSPYTSPIRTARESILGKRASQDRDSSFGSSEERSRRSTGIENDLTDINASTESGLPLYSDVPDTLSSRMDRNDVTPKVDLSQLGLTSPITDARSRSASEHMINLTNGYKEDALAEAGPPSPVSPPPFPPSTIPPPLPPRRHSKALVAAEKFGLQQDAAEILINILAQLEYAFDPPRRDDGSKPTNLIQSLFSAKFRQQMLLESAGGAAVESHPPVDAVFVHPIIGVEEEGKDLYDCLAELYLGGAEIEYEGQKGFKMDLIDELPPMLYIQMRRSQYDAARRSQTKTNTHVPFGRTLVMDRFLASADPVKRDRSITLTRDIMKMRARRHDLKNRKPMSIPDTFKFARSALGLNQDLLELGITEGLLQALADEENEADREIDTLEANIPAAKAELEALWEVDRAVEYELVSVFVHGGTGTGGHYWTYQADLPRDGNRFYYYSDENVKQVEVCDVFSDKSAQGVSPALLCYVRKARDLVDTLHRAAIVEAPYADTDEHVEEQDDGKRPDAADAGDERWEYMDGRDSGIGTSEDSALAQ